MREGGSGEVDEAAQDRSVLEVVFGGGFQKWRPGSRSFFIFPWTGLGGDDCQVQPRAGQNRTGNVGGGVRSEVVVRVFGDGDGDVDGCG